MTCGISTGDKWDGDHILGFMVMRMGKSIVPGRFGLGVTSPGLVPESRNELPPVSWTSKVKSREWEAFRVCGSGVEA